MALWSANRASNDAPHRPGGLKPRAGAAVGLAAVTAPADHRFLAACRGEDHDRVPVWFMRQAGRSLPEYRAARGDGSILDAIRQPELAAELTMQPVRRHGVEIGRAHV